MTAKEEILSRIAGAKVESFVAPRPVVSSSLRSREEIVSQFIYYAEEYKARVRTVDPADLSAAIRESVPEESGVLIPEDLPISWLPESMKPTKDAAFTAQELERFTTVVTGCAVAIAETGTFVLDSGFAQGRRALSLIPDHHVCVVFEDQILDSVAEAIALLQAPIDAGQPLTWISGPSATSDIELNRVEGVHGPRNLDILVVRRQDPTQ